MESIFQQITDWLKGVLVSGIMDNLTGTFQSVNDQVGQIANKVGQTPAGFLPDVYSLIRNISETVILPIAGMILTFISCYELIQLVISHNNMANFETWIFFKWIFKTFIAVTLISNTFTITMAVFDVAQWVVTHSGGLIQNSTAVDDSALDHMLLILEGMDLGSLFGIFMQSMVVQMGIHVLSIAIFVIINGRMIEIYLMTSLAPIPFATFGNREQSIIGQNYLRSLLALGTMERKDQNILKPYLMKEKTMDEVAIELGIEYRSAIKHVYRIKKRLIEKVEPQLIILNGRGSKKIQHGAFQISIDGTGGKSHL